MKLIPLKYATFSSANGIPNRVQRMSTQQIYVNRNLCGICMENAFISQDPTNRGISGKVSKDSDFQVSRYLPLFALNPI